MVTDLLADGAFIVLHHPDWASWSPAGAAVASFLRGWPRRRCRRSTRPCGGSTWSSSSASSTSSPTPSTSTCSRRSSTSTSGSWSPTRTSRRWTWRWSTSAPTGSRTSPGSRCSTSTPARSAGAARRSAPPRSRGSRSGPRTSGTTCGTTSTPRPSSRWPRTSPCPRTGSSSAAPCPKGPSGSWDTTSRPGREKALGGQDQQGHDLGLHHLRLLRVGLPPPDHLRGQARPDAPLPHPRGERLPRRGPGGLQGHGAPGQSLEPAPGRPGQVGRGPGRPPHGREARGGVPVLGGLRGRLRRRGPEGLPGPGEAPARPRASPSPSWAPRRPARATAPGVWATSTSSRPSPRPTSRPSTGTRSRRSSPTAPTASTP